MASNHDRLAGALAVALSLAALPAGAAGAGDGPDGAWVRLRDQRVLELRAARAGAEPGARAHVATRALEAAAAPGAAAEAAVEGDEAVVRVGGTVVLRLGPEDAAAAGAPVAELGDRAAAALRAALAREGRRLAAHDAVYALSMVVFGGLVAFLLARWAGGAARGLAGRLEGADARVPALTVGGVEVLSGPLVRGAAALALRLGSVVVQLAVLVAWILSALSQFEATRGARDELAAAVAHPLLDLGARVLQGIPLLLALALAAGLVALLVRAAGVYFEAVAAGDAAHDWLPRDLAPALGRLAQAGVALGAVLALAAVAGGDGLVGGLARAVALALGLGAAPLVACALAGLPLLLGRAVRPGDLAELGGQRGTVVEVGALSVVLEPEGGGRVRVPHLLSLLRPVRVERRGPGAPR